MEEAQIKESKKKNSKKELLNKAILLFVLVLILSAVLYLSNTNVFRGAGRAPEQSQSKESELLLDCEKKIAQGEDLLTPQEEEECLFLGCGDFFR